MDCCVELWSGTVRRVSAGVDRICELGRVMESCGRNGTVS